MFAGISFRMILPKIVSPPSYFACAFSTSDIASTATVRAWMHAAAANAHSQMRARFLSQPTSGGATGS